MVSFDIWEETFSVTKTKAPRKTASHLSAKGVESWCMSQMSLDLPGRTTREYEGPTVAPRVQAALDAAMANVEPDIDIDVGALSSGAAAVRGLRARGGNNKRQQQQQAG